VDGYVVKYKLSLWTYTFFAKRLRESDWAGGYGTAGLPHTVPLTEEEKSLWPLPYRALSQKLPVKKDEFEEWKKVLLSRRKGSY
jgi:hypothetical protein